MIQPLSLRLVLVAGSLLLAILAGCGGSDAPPSPPSEAPPAPAPVEAPPEPTQVEAPPEKAVALPKPASPAGAMIAGALRVVDLEGQPVPNIAPIACRSANAFQKPEATGPLTNEEGRSVLEFPNDQHLFIRGWDPELRYFPNNFFEVFPEEAQSIQEMVLIMVPAAAVQAILLDSTGAPLVEEEVGLMMVHPTEGPWWPAEATSNEAGFITFDAIPAGGYSLRLKALSGPFLEIPETVLMPGQTMQLGPVQLR